jgi:hypothetical protein
MYYRTIDRVNRVLAALPNAKAANATEEALKSRIRGEALFLRAFCHFGLYQFYSNTSDGTALALAYMETPDLLPQARITVAPYMAKLNADVVQGWRHYIPLKRGGTPEDVANACLYFASDMSAYVSGQVLNVCGGMLT